MSAAPSETPPTLTPRSIGVVDPLTWVEVGFAGLERLWSICPLGKRRGMGGSENSNPSPKSGKLGKLSSAEVSEIHSQLASEAVDLGCDAAGL